MPLFERAEVLGAACGFGLSLVSLALGGCVSRLGLDAGIGFCQCLGRGSVVEVCAGAEVSVVLPQGLLWEAL